MYFRGTSLFRYESTVWPDPGMRHCDINGFEIPTDDTKTRLDVSAMKKKYKMHPKRIKKYQKYFVWNKRTFAPILLLITLISFYSQVKHNKIQIRRELGYKWIIYNGILFKKNYYVYNVDLIFHHIIMFCNNHLLSLI